MEEDDATVEGGNHWHGHKDVLTTQYWVRVGHGSSSVFDITPELRKRLGYAISERLATLLLESTRGDMQKAGHVILISQRS